MIEFICLVSYFLKNCSRIFMYNIMSGGLKYGKRTLKHIYVYVMSGGSGYCKRTFKLVRVQCLEGQLETFVKFDFSGKRGKFCKLNISYHLKAHLFIFPTTSHSLTIG